MSRISRLVDGIASAERSRARIRRTGLAPNGSPVWTEQELATVRELYPDYQRIVKALGRSYAAVRSKAQLLGLTPKRFRWTGEKIVRLRRLYYRSATAAEIRAEFPGTTLDSIRKMADYYGLRRPRKRFASTGFLIIDQIRSRCFELNLSMADLDAMAKTGRYFTSAGWHSALPPRALAKAVQALDGELSVRWRDEPEPVAARQAIPTLSIAA